MCNSALGIARSNSGKRSGVTAWTLNMLIP